MTRAAAFVVPGSLDGRTGGYIYDRHMVEGLRALGWDVQVHQLHESFPQPTPGALAHAGDVFGSIRSGTLTIIDSLACGAMPDILERHASRLVLVALVHLPLSAEIGLDEATAAGVAANERRALAAARLIVVTGRATPMLLERYGLPSSRIVVVEPGTHPLPLASGSGGLPVQLLSVATLNQGKGHVDLLTALATVPSRDWRLTCAGSLTRDPPTVERVRAVIRQLRCSDRVALVGELRAAALDAQYDRADVFVLATRRETFGMAVAEALARGLPVVSTSTGAIPELVGAEAGLLVEPGDVQGLSKALSRVIGDGALRARLAEGARRARARLRTWDEAAARLAATLEPLADG